MLGQAGHVQVGAFDGFTAGTSKGHLELCKYEMEIQPVMSGTATLIVLFCNRNPLSVCIALEASSCL